MYVAFEYVCMDEINFIRIFLNRKLYVNVLMC